MEYVKLSASNLGVSRVALSLAFRNQYEGFLPEVGGFDVGVGPYHDHVPLPLAQLGW